jgi:hypothetical protein
LLIRRQEIENPSPEQIRAILETSQEVQFHAEGRADIYAWVDRTLRQQDYAKVSRATEGLVRRYLTKTTGLSRAQVDALDRPVCEDPSGQADGVSAAPIWSALHNG